jgi:aspartate/methionine/tyrosine aminotransferase
MCVLFGLPGFIQEAAVTAIGVAPEAEARIRAYCALRQQRLEHGLRGIAPLRLLPPQAGMFVLIDVTATGLSGAEFATALYSAQRVSVMDGAAFGPSAAHCVRVCFATDEATLDEACARLRRFCEQDLPAIGAGRGKSSGAAQPVPP